MPQRIRIHAGVPAAGYYDHIVDSRLESLLEYAAARGVVVQTRPLIPAHDIRLIAREVTDALITALHVRTEETDSTVAEVDLANRLLDVLIEQDPTLRESKLTSKVLQRVGGGSGQQPPDLSEHGLLTGREGGETLLGQLRRELGTADRIDWLVSFIKLAGVKVLQTGIEAFLARGGRMRLVTTAYMGATDPEALELLAVLSSRHGENLSIRFSRECDATRLHAKAYIHHRDSGCGTAYIGSANLSRPALTDGLEWTVRLAQTASPGLWTKIEETFEQWWEDPEFVEFGLAADHPSHRQFRELVARERGQLSGAAHDSTSFLPIFDLSPKPFQEAILDKIAAEREELRKTRHLVVAATGTGKTMIAAFDFRRFSKQFRLQFDRQPRLLYVAHAERIVKQARLAFAHVQRDLNFGSFLVGGIDQTGDAALFATIQSLQRVIDEQRVSPDFYDYVVLDEIHRSAAPTWRALLDWMQPKSVLGLTATPERTDGQDVTEYFGGCFTAEIRLPEAIARRLLVPFRYFGVTDELDFRHVNWTSTGYDREQLEAIYLDAGLQWAEGIRRAVHEYVASPTSMRAVGFCSGVRHAVFMAEAFERCRLDNEARGVKGLRAASLSGESSVSERESVIGQLRRGELQIVFVADLFNEGVDIPELDTVLFLRPTDSLTIYIQQLGRGLRLSPTTGKDSLTVLDFVGHHHAQFRFSERIEALLGQACANLVAEVKGGFASLPPGCSIALEREAMGRILENIQAHVRSASERLKQAYRALASRFGREPSISDCLRATDLDPRALYPSNGPSRCWNEITLHASQPRPHRANSEVRDCQSALKAIAACDDTRVALVGQKLLAALESGREREVLNAEPSRVAMLLVEFGNALTLPAHASSDEYVSRALSLLRASRALRDELSALLEYLAQRVTGLTPEPRAPLPPGVGLSLHRTYTRKQLLVGFGWDEAWWTTLQSGAIWIPERNSSLMLVTLDKESDSFTERTRYRDYAISPTRFHWQSQASAHAGTVGGRRIEAAKRGDSFMWLFVRKAQVDVWGREPFVFLGLFRPSEISGDRPMSVTGELDNALLAAWYDFASRAR